MKLEFLSYQLIPKDSILDRSCYKSRQKLITTRQTQRNSSNLALNVVFSLFSSFILFLLLFFKGLLVLEMIHYVYKSPHFLCIKLEFLFIGNSICSFNYRSYRSCWKLAGKKITDFLCMYCNFSLSKRLAQMGADCVMEVLNGGIEEMLLNAKAQVCILNQYAIDYIITLLGFRMIFTAHVLPKLQKK